DAGPQAALSADGPVNFSRPSIDVLFESAAEIFGGRLLAIVLSGASQDGAAGPAAVRRAGGWTAVQDPQTAQVPVMPKAALERTPADFVLPLDGLASLLSTFDRGGT